MKFFSVFSLKFLVASFLIAIISIIFYFNIEENVSVVCVHHVYACGECYPEYEIKKVLNSDKQSLVGKNIFISFENDSIENDFNKQNIYPIMYDYYFEGNLHYSIVDFNYVLCISKYKLRNN